MSRFAAAALVLTTMGPWPRQRRRGEKPRLRLAQSLGAFPRPGGDISPLFVFFTVSNAGEGDATVARLYVEPKDGCPLSGVNLLGGEGELPHAVAPGETARFQVRARELARVLKNEGHGGRPRVKLVVVDASGARHEHRFRFRVDEYLALKDE